MKRVQNSRGFTLIEVLHAGFILSFVMTALVSVMVMTMRMDRDSIVESLLLTEGMNIMQRIEKGRQGRYGVMKSRAASVVVAAGQNRIDFSVDTNATYTDSTADDTAMAIYYDNGDGDDLTYDDNAVILNDGTDITTIGQNVSNLSFTFQNSIVTVNLSLTDDVEGQPVTMNVNRDIWVRNS